MKPPVDRSSTKQGRQCIAFVIQDLDLPSILGEWDPAVERPERLIRALVETLPSAISGVSWQTPEKPMSVTFSYDHGLIEPIHDVYQKWSRVNKTSPEKTSGFVVLFMECNAQHTVAEKAYLLRNLRPARDAVGLVGLRENPTVEMEFLPDSVEVNDRITLNLAQQLIDYINVDSRVWARMERWPEYKQLIYRVSEAVREAEKMGFDVEITNTPAQPLAMGNKFHTIDVRPARSTYNK